jgi:hypothetical protein
MGDGGGRRIWTRRRGDAEEDAEKTTGGKKKERTNAEEAERVCVLGFDAKMGAAVGTKGSDYGLIFMIS